ncbi:MAG TPA: hypothetical protein VK348_12600 [Planctomycetota bacterium]|nr:hypothetical protein [Planctomycetota bacterium]
MSVPWPGSVSRALAASAVLLATAVAQTRPAEDLRRVIDAWLDSDQVDEAQLDKTVASVLDAGRIGLRLLGDDVRAATDPASKRTKGTLALAVHVSLEFLKRQTGSKMTFAGQYDPLRPLQPFAGKLFTRLLLDSPQWFPSTHRVQLVPALRDLFPEPPGDELIAGAVSLVENEDLEPKDLRRALACALHQWGRKQYVQPDLDRWQKQSSEGDPEDRALALRNLAELHYQLRDYRAAAATYMTLVALAESSGVPLWPTDYYAQACTLSLASEAERALAALEKCAELQASPSVDASVKLERSLWEQDPELALVRGTERFKKAFAKAFPATRQDH